MGFKTNPSFSTLVTNFFTNLPRRVTGKPLIHSSDPEICDAASQNMITAAFNYAASHIVDIDLMGGECSKLATCLAGKTVSSSLEITCAYCTGGKEHSASSSASNNTIQLCLSNFGATLSQDIVNGLVFRELIRMCGGMELDAYGLDSYFSCVKHPAGGTLCLTVPQGVLQIMYGDSIPGVAGQSIYRAGKFLVWVPSLGTLYDKVLSSSAPSGWRADGNTLTGSCYASWQYTP
jgi:hypothetical protein